MTSGVPRALAAMSGNIVYAVGQWALVIVIARLGSAALLGEYTFALAIAAPLFMLANLRLRFVLASDHDRTPFADFLKLRMLLSGLAAVMVVSIGALVAPVGMGLGILVAVTAFKVVESIGDIGLGLFQAREKMALMGRVLWLLALSNVVLFSTAFVCFRSITIACAAMAVARAALLHWYEAPRWQAVESERAGVGVVAARPVEAWTQVSNARVIELFRRAWPLGGSAVLDSLNTNIPRYFVMTAAGATGLGIFSAMTTLSQAVFLLVNSFAQLRLPLLSRTALTGAWSQFGVTLGSITAVAAVFGASGVVIAWGGADDLLRLMFGEEFVSEVTAFVPVMLAGAFSTLALVVTYGLTALGHYRVQVYGYLACTVTIVALCSQVASGSGLAEFAMALVKAQLVHVAVAGALLWMLVRRRHFSGRLHGT